MGKGKVWLVGAGPSDVGLFTLKGKQVLEQAEVVVYDALVGHGVLAMVPKSAELIDVGKRAGNHTLPQEMINQVLLEKAMEGKRVVRLKGGDPFLFGRGGEELELLTENDIPFEIVPGVTSAISVPAYNGIPVTHRDFCSSLHIITGHKKKGREYDIDFEALVRTKGTLVFLMGITAMEDICKGLMAGGMSPDMPAAVLQKGTSARQKRVVATVGTLKAASDAAKIETPAIIVVGKVCTVAEQFTWYEKLPLQGCRVLVTRPKELASRMTDQLREKGAEVVELPAIQTEAILPNKQLEEAIASIEKYQWVVFTSQIGVRIFYEALKNARIDVRRMNGLKIAAIGKGTKAEVENHGMFVDLMPSIYDGESLGRELAGVCEKGDQILIPRARIGSHELIEELEKAEGVKIDEIPTYDTVLVESHLIDEKKEFAAGNMDYAIFTSASTVRGFEAATPGLDYSTVEAVCIGKQTAAEAEKLGMKVHISKIASIASVAQLTEELFAAKKASL
ncbi:MAG: uroporphyrinogen-III C-methyltransferase [Lachnospiraceae bacterium]|nr:uroporphyrinogen-III C-methyltransferase [Lachnospiraceae bacterium]